MTVSYTTPQILSIILSYFYNGCWQDDIDGDLWKSVKETVELLECVHFGETEWENNFNKLASVYFFDLWSLAIKYNRKDLEGYIVDYIAKQFQTCLKDKKFPLLTVNQLINILSHKVTTAYDEVAMLSAIRLWIDHDVNTRKPHISNLLSFICVSPESKNKLAETWQVCTTPEIGSPTASSMQSSREDSGVVISGVKEKWSTFLKQAMEMPLMVEAGMSPKPMQHCSQISLVFSPQKNNGDISSSRNSSPSQRTITDKRESYEILNTMFSLSDINEREMEDKESCENDNTLIASSHSLTDDESPKASYYKSLKSKMNDKKNEHGKVVVVNIGANSLNSLAEIKFSSSSEENLNLRIGASIPMENRERDATAVKASVSADTFNIVNDNETYTLAHSNSVSHLDSPLSFYDQSLFSMDETETETSRRCSPCFKDNIECLTSRKYMKVKSKEIRDSFDVLKEKLQQSISSSKLKLGAKASEQTIPIDSEKQNVKKVRSEMNPKDFPCKTAAKQTSNKPNVKGNKQIIKSNVMAPSQTSNCCQTIRPKLLSSENLDKHLSHSKHTQAPDFKRISLKDGMNCSEKENATKTEKNRIILCDLRSQDIAPVKPLPNVHTSKMPPSPDQETLSDLCASMEVPLQNQVVQSNFYHKNQLHFKNISTSFFECNERKQDKKGKEHRRRKSSSKTSSVSIEPLQILSPSPRSPLSISAEKSNSSSTLKMLFAQLRGYNKNMKKQEKISLMKLYFECKLKNKQFNREILPEEKQLKSASESALECDTKTFSDVLDKDDPRKCRPVLSHYRLKRRSKMKAGADFINDDPQIVLLVEDHNGNAFRQFYNLRSKKWYKKCLPLVMPLDQRNCSVLYEERKIYFIGGKKKRDLHCLNSVFVYDCSLRALEQLPDSLVARTNAAVCIMNRNLYIIGGLSIFDRTLPLAECLEHEGTSWAFIATLQYPRADASAVNDGKFLYVLGGLHLNHQNEIHMVRECERYDPRSNQWTVITELPNYFTKCRLLTVSVLENILAIKQECPDKIFEYSIKYNKWNVFNDISGSPMKIDTLMCVESTLFAFQKELKAIYFLKLASSKWKILTEIPQKLHWRGYVYGMWQT